MHIYICVRIGKIRTAKLLKNKDIKEKGTLFWYFFIIKIKIKDNKNEEQDAMSSNRVGSLRTQ